jgi:uncharacterized protein (TIGR02145 family)
MFCKFDEVILLNYLLLKLILENLKELNLQSNIKEKLMALFSFRKNNISENVNILKDVDGNEYNTIKIGKQLWMVENLTVTHYNDGKKISLINDNTEWSKLSTAAYCYHDVFGKCYGAFYNWYAINNGKLAPKGWRIPTDDDWTELEEYLINNSYNYLTERLLLLGNEKEFCKSKESIREHFRSIDNTGEYDEFCRQKIAKSLAAKKSWYEYDNEEGDIGYDLSRNNSSGFTALPQGCRLIDGDFNERELSCYWWSASEFKDNNAIARKLFTGSSYLIKLNEDKRYGLSVRCVKNSI